MSDEDDFIRITLRIPKGLHASLTDAAAKKRSMNAEIIARLESTFGREEALEDARKEAMLFEVKETRRRMEEMDERVKLLERYLASDDSTPA